MNKLKSYTGIRSEIAQFVPPKGSRILDIGCSNGALGQALKTQNKNHYVIGIENDSDLASAAEKSLDEVIYGDLNYFNEIQLHKQPKFDCIILADVLEHLINPTPLLTTLSKHHLNDKGNIIISLPNVCHILTFQALFRKKWPRNERGLFDKTHLQWFGIKNIEELINDSGLTISNLHRNYRISDNWKSPINRYSRFIAKTPLRDYITYQYIVNTHKFTF